MLSAYLCALASLVAHTFAVTRLWLSALKGHLKVLNNSPKISHPYTPLTLATAKAGNAEKHWRKQAQLTTIAVNLNFLSFCPDHSARPFNSNTSQALATIGLGSTLPFTAYAAKPCHAIQRKSNALLSAVTTAS